MKEQIKASRQIHDVREDVRIMKKKYLAVAGIVTVMEAMLFGCGAKPLAGGEGVPGGAMVLANENQTQETEGTQAANTKLDQGTDTDGGTGGTEYAECGGPEIGEEILPRMVMLDGKLYVDTNETNSMIRCGTMDGTITSTTDGEMPTKDGQSNFGKDIGYQRGMRENRIEICLDNVWHIFAYNENNLDGVSLEIADVTNKGATVKVHNQSDQEITFGEDFALEVLDKKTREWTYAPIIVDGEWGFNDVGLPVNSKDTRDWEVDWTWLYGELAPGQYRIIKGVLSEAISEGMRTEGTGSYVKYTLSCEFTVNAN